MPSAILSLALLAGSALAHVTARAAAITAASLQQVSGFGTNPTKTQMYIYVPTKLATNPAIVVAVSCRVRVERAKC